MLKHMHIPFESLSFPVSLYLLPSVPSRASLLSKNASRVLCRGCFAAVSAGLPSPVNPSQTH